MTLSDETSSESETDVTNTRGRQGMSVTWSTLPIDMTRRASNCRKPAIATDTSCDPTIWACYWRYPVALNLPRPTRGRSTRGRSSARGISPSQSRRFAPFPGRDRRRQAPDESGSPSSERVDARFRQRRADQAPRPRRGRVAAVRYVASLRSIPVQVVDETMPFLLQTAAVSLCSRRRSPAPRAASPSAV